MGAPQGTERLVLFTDAVVAIAITLLVLPLVDEVNEAVDAGEPSAEVLTRNGRAILSFLLSFLVIAKLWLVHHGLFRRITVASRGIVFWNMAWVFTIVVVPFSTEFVGGYGDDPLTMALYVGTVLASSACLTVMSVVAHRRVLPEAVGPTALLAVALLLVLFVPVVGYYPLLLLFFSPLLERLLARGLGPRTA